MLSANGKVICVSMKLVPVPILFPEARANEGRLHQWKQNVQKTVLNVCDKIKD